MARLACFRRRQLQFLFYFGAELQLRFSVALQAPSHCQRLHFADHFHLIQLAVAIRAIDSTIHMYRVIEIGIVGQAMNALPFHWRQFIGLERIVVLIRLWQFMQIPAPGMVAWGDFSTCV